MSPLSLDLLMKEMVGTTFNTIKRQYRFVYCDHHFQVDRNIGNYKDREPFVEYLTLWEQTFIGNTDKKGNIVKHSYLDGHDHGVTKDQVRNWLCKALVTATLAGPPQESDE